MVFWFCGFWVLAITTHSSGSGRGRGRGGGSSSDDTKPLKTAVVWLSTAIKP